MIWAVLDYSAIVHPIGDPGVMREQIQFLIRAAALPYVRIQILLSGAGRLAATGNSFALLRFRGANLPDIVDLPHLGSHILLSHPADTEMCRKEMGEISIAAENPDSTLEILRAELRRIEAHRGALRTHFPTPAHLVADSNAYPVPLNSKISRPLKG